MTRALALSRRQFVATAAVLAAAPLHNSARAETPNSKVGDSLVTLTPYLLFDGACAEAMKFYKSVFGGELNLTKVKDSPARSQMQPFQQEKVLNAHLKSGTIQISASDWLALHEKPLPGNTACLFLNGGSVKTLNEVFRRLSIGASIMHPLMQKFFGTYGALTDKFGVRWMFQTNNRE